MLTRVWKSKPPELPFDPANVVVRWLRLEGFEPTNATVSELRIGYIRFEVEFDAGDESTVDRREQYEEFLEDCSLVNTRESGPQIWPKHLWRAADLLPLLRAECAYNDCSDESEEFVICPNIDRVRSYCSYHADRARDHFLGYAGGEHVRESNEFSL